MKDIWWDVGRGTRHTDGQDLSPSPGQTQRGLAVLACAPNKTSTSPLPVVCNSCSFSLPIPPPNFV
jgi:hypothetical protein